MALDSAAQPQVGPRFSIITKALAGGGTDPETGRRRFHATASSTIIDRSGDEIQLSALQKMAEKFRRGVTIFIDHDFEHAESAFGLTDTAEIIQRSVDPVTNIPVWDLDIGGVVNTPSPRAVQLADSIDGGYVQLGTSISAFVRKHSRKPTGGMLISDLDVFEASIVGVPDNERSWAQKAVRAIKSFKYPKQDEEETVSDEVIEKGMDAPTPPVSPAMPNDGNELPDGETRDEPSVETPTPAEAPGSDESVNEDGQASDEASGDEPETPSPESPETASSDESPADADADPPTVEKAYDPGEVGALVKQAGLLVGEVGRLRTENAELRAKVESYEADKGALTSEVEQARQVIEKVMAMPLRPRTAEHVETFAATHELFASTPEIAEYIQKRRHLTHE